LSKIVHGMSEEAHDLIKALLKISAQKRATAEEGL
jgi:hypothetical protein